MISGPIACLIEADDWFDLKYDGGIIMPRKFSGTNHVISVSGWGSEVVNGTEIDYWIVVRTECASCSSTHITTSAIATAAGGESKDGASTSFSSSSNFFCRFRIQRGLNVLGIESECAWGVPVLNSM